MKQTLAIALATLLVAQAFVAPASAATLTDSPDPTIEQYDVGGDFRPSFVVEFDANKTASFRDWSNASDSRLLVDIDTSSGRATVAAPATDVTGVWKTFLGQDIEAPFTTELEERGYIDAVYPNHIHSVPDRPDTLKRSEFETPTIGTLSYNDPAFATDGMAFSDDVNKTRLATSRKTLGANNVTATGNGLSAAVIDTGALTAEGRTFGNGSVGSTIRISNASKNFVSDGEPTVNESGYDAIADGSDSLHGTWTAAALAANTSGTTNDGVAPDANLLILKALADDGSGSTSDISSSIRYAADQNVDVISMSLGSKVRSEPIENAIAYAHDKGSIVVVAAGNSRMTSGAELASPGDYGPAITVAATDSGNGTAANVRSASFSQTGPEPSAGDLGGSANVGNLPDVAGPGYKTTARIPTSKSGGLGNVTLSGTSMITPKVSGGVLIAMSANSTLASASPSTVHDSVRATARPAPNTAEVEVGAGVFAADNLATGTTSGKSQSEVMTDAASQRDAFYRAQSDSGVRSYLGNILTGS